MEQSSYPDHVRHASAPFIVRMAEDTSRANLAIAISSHGFELHGLGKIGHVHHQTGICEVPIAVEETGHASIKETQTQASWSSTNEPESPLSAKQVCSRNASPFLILLTTTNSVISVESTPWTL